MNIIDSFSLPRSLILGAIITLTNPLDLVKSRLQTMPQLLTQGHLSRNYKGVFDCFKTVKTHEGIRGLLKGNTLGLARFFPNEFLNLKIKRFFNSLLPKSFLNDVFSGAAAGWGANSILYPIDTLRIIVSNIPRSNQKYYLWKMLREIGIKFLYCGYSSSIVAIGLYRGSFYGIYDTLKVKSSCNFQKYASAYFSSLMANLLVYPLDTIRRRRIISNSSENSLSFMLRVIKGEGIKGLFRGCSISCFQSIAAALVLISFNSDQNTEF